MAMALMPAWIKVRKALNKLYPELLVEEHRLLERMTVLFDRHTQAAISLTAQGGD